LFLIAAFGVSCQRTLKKPDIISIQKREEWKAGVASVVITPQQSMWMAGYAARTKPSDGKVHDLHAKAISLEDFQGGRLIIVTVDLEGFHVRYVTGWKRQRKSYGFIWQKWYPGNHKRLGWTAKNHTWEIQV
jgi:hypothetical protein